MKVTIDSNDFYCIPKWCQMPLFQVFKTVSICLGISKGLVLLDGKEYCLECEYYKDRQHHKTKKSSAKKQTPPRQE